MSAVADQDVEPSFDPSRPVPLYALTYLEEGGEVTVGRRDADVYAVLPADGGALLRRLETGMSAGEAADWYQETYGEGVDIAGFVEALEELGFVRPRGATGADGAATATGSGEGAPVSLASSTADTDTRHATATASGTAHGATTTPATESASGRTVRWSRLGKAVYSPVGGLIAAALLAAALVESIRVPGLAPRYTDVFFSSSMVVCAITVAFGQVPLILLHEAAHALAGRRLGLNSRLSVDRRLYYVVFVTALNGLVTVPRRKRYLPMLAGMLLDLLLVAAFTLVADITRESGQLTTAGRVLLALAYFTLLRILWQFLFYLETDLYYVLNTALNCVDLHKTARRVAYNRIARLFGRRTARYDESEFHPRDRRAARWYSWLVVFGYAGSLGLLAMALLPTGAILGRVFGRFLHPAAQSVGGLLDSGIFVLLILAQISLLIWPTYRRRRAARPAAGAAS